MEAIRFQDSTLYLLDQRRLPHEETWLRCDTIPKICEAIVTLAVRGAPAIGVTAAYGLVVGLQDVQQRTGRITAEDFKQVQDTLAATRPTAVNLFWALERQEKIFRANPKEPLAALLEEARMIHQEDIEMCRTMGRFGAEVIDDGDGCLTHCNAGALATGGYGTALGVFRAAWEEGKKIHVYADETRPLLQGSRLTTYEMIKEGIPVTLLCDTMTGQLMKSGKVQKVVVGSDRTAANGDVANKIGTMQVAILAKHFGIPFYAALPTSTIDMSLASGDDIPIEMRSGDEVAGFGETLFAPAGVDTFTPAFDVTPHELVAGIITEKGIVRAPYTENLKKLFA